jgi:hypothetical protein
VEILQRLFQWQDEELRDFTRILGSLFPITNEANGEVIKPYHKSLADWLSDEAKAGAYFASSKEGHRTLGIHLLEIRKANHKNRLYPVNLCFGHLFQSGEIELVHQAVRDGLLWRPWDERLRRSRHEQREEDILGGWPGSWFVVMDGRPGIDLLCKACPFMRTTSSMKAVECECPRCGYGGDLIEERDFSGSLELRELLAPKSLLELLSPSRAVRWPQVWIDHWSSGLPPEVNASISNDHPESHLHGWSSTYRG